MQLSLQQGCEPEGLYTMPWACVKDQMCIRGLWSATYGCRILTEKIVTISAGIERAVAKFAREDLNTLTSENAFDSGIALLHLPKQGSIAVLIQWNDESWVIWSIPSAGWAKMARSSSSDFKELCKKGMCMFSEVACLQLCCCIRGHRCHEEVRKLNLMNSVCVLADMHLVGRGSLTAQYILVLDALNFCFWPQKELQYANLARGLKVRTQD